MQVGPCLLDGAIAGNPKSEIRPAATARQRGENKFKKMEIFKIGKEISGVLQRKQALNSQLSTLNSSKTATLT